MKAHLMYRDQDFLVDGDLPWGSDGLIDDLELKTLFAAMAHDDGFLFDVVQTAVMTSLREPQQITYRQDVLRDCVANPDTVRELYRVSIEAIETKKRSQFGLFVYPDAMLMTALDLMQAFMSVLLKLRDLADLSIGRFRSEGFITFFTMIQRELADEYLKTLRRHLTELEFRKGTLISAALGRGNKGTSYILRMPDQAEGNVLKRFFGRKPPSLTFHIAERDDAGARALSVLRVRGINLAADAVAQSVDHVLSFFVCFGLNWPSISVASILSATSTPKIGPCAIRFPRQYKSAGIRVWVFMTYVCRCGSRPLFPTMRTQTEQI
ncbi:hypothetical protein [Burkholderia multivorans]|uniref:hypothetical protein n=1 Tax=Burkholderia multivorans TaxID=87883 RepID=UPI0021BE9BB9|nr:hypothetical protein [Burkholderia multivorans]